MTSNLAGPIARTYRALEWERLKDHLAREAETAWGKEICLAIEPASESLVVIQLLDESQEALSLLAANSGPALSNLPDIRETIARAGAGACLSGQELAALRAVLVSCRVTRASFMLLDKQTFPELAKYAQGLHALAELVTAIDTAIDETGEIKDTASALLGQLRREVRKIDKKIKDELNKIIHSSTLSKALQEPIFTQRGGRYVLPVDASSRGTISGIVHDSSASGLTVYIEPTSVVELANNMRLVESEIEREISRILTELSAQVQKEIDKVDQSFKTLIELDCIFARARLARKYKGLRPDISDKGKFELRKARHPLLALQYPAGQVVGNDILLGDGIKTMVVTGPNTGGKTVLLKTAGLLVLMLKAGMLLPVDNGSKCGVFKDVYADIGDEQSIEQSLSTFSSHMTNIIEIVKRAGAGSLIILDEIGAGTDPKEGAALARAILEHLTQSGAYTISATHFGELKTLAYSQEGFVNASLEFDEATLSPTYRLRIGIPGGSKATTIARRLGLNEQVVSKAESLMQAADRDMQEVIEKLEQKFESLSALEEKAQAAKQAAERKEQEAEKLLSELSEEQEGERRSFANRIESEFKQAKDSVRAMVANLQKEPSLQKAEKFKQEIEDIRKDLKWLEPARPGLVGAQHAVPGSLTIGAMVKVRSLNTTGTIESLPSNFATDPKTLVTVNSGGKRLKVSARDLEFISASKPKDLGARASQPASKRKGQIASSEESLNAFVRTSFNTLDLRGQRVDEAMVSLESFLDTCYLQNISPVMVIHGHGTGAVKSACRSYFSESSYVNNFRPGELYEGGDGVSIVDIS